MKHKLPTTLELSGLQPAPPQQLGAVRLIPLLRAESRSDLRLGLRRYKAGFGEVALDSQVDKPGIKYQAYIPHGLVLSWSDDGTPVTAFGTRLAPPEEEAARPARRDPFGVQLHHRMVRRESDHSLRFLPLHLAMEGFMIQHFGGPDIAWSEYSRQALRTGLSPRTEIVAPGRSIEGLQDALRVFEIYEDQCGVIVLVADALASVFVVPHAADYRLLHRTLVEDFFAELIREYSQHYHAVPELDFYVPPPPGALHSLAELRACLDAAQERWGQSCRLFAQGLLGRALRSQRVYQAGGFLLSRFTTELRLEDENHIGEIITREDGTVEYMKTYRLSPAQVRRAYLLDLLHRFRWDLSAAAASIGKHRGQLVYQLVGAGLGYLISDQVLKAARRGTL